MRILFKRDASRMHLPKVNDRTLSIVRIIRYSHACVLKTERGKGAVCKILTTTRDTTVLVTRLSPIIEKVTG